MTPTPLNLPPRLPHDQFTSAFADLKAAGCTIDSEDWNEADTRSKFIDTVLFDCLGWSEADVARENHVDKDRLDYLLTVQKPAIVVEAKRAKLSLKAMQTKVAGPRRIQIEKLVKANPSLKRPIRQVARYCWRWSAPLAVLTNGRTFIIFIAVRTEGTPWMKGSALVFPDIFSTKFDFATLANLLSKTAIAEGRLHAALMGNDSPPPPENVLSSYSLPNALVATNNISLAIEPLLREVFSDVTKEDSPAVLEHCYVPPAEGSFKRSEFEALLVDMPPSYTPAVINVSTANAFKKFQDNLKSYLVSTSLDQTLLLVGGVGVGKTMFLKHYFTVGADTDLVRQKTVPLFIDFRKPELDPTKVADFVYEKLYDELVTFEGRDVPGETGKKYDFFSEPGLIQMFWRQKQRFDQLEGSLRGTPDGDLAYQMKLVDFLAKLRENRKEFVRAASRLLRERYHRHVCVILDNADQCEPEYQRAVYIFSRTLNSDLNTLVIVSLREEWYWHFGVKSTGPLSAYHDIIYHVPAPRLRDVLARRLDYAIKLIRSNMPRVQVPFGMMELTTEQLAKYLEATQNAFLNDEPITTLYESLSNGSVREGLDIFLEYLRSGHTGGEQYLLAISQKGYAVQFDRVFDAIACGQHRYYASHRSIVPNLLLPVPGVSTVWNSYFARVYFLEWLASRAKVTAPAGRGFVPVTLAKGALARIGVDDDLHQSLLTELFEGGLVESDIRLATAVEQWEHVRITSKGLYLLRALPTRFVYWEKVMLDTPLSDKPMLARIRSLYLEGDPPPLPQRIRCVKDFVAFVRKAEELEQIRIRTAGMANECPPFLSGLERTLDEDFARLETGGTRFLFGTAVQVTGT